MLDDDRFRANASLFKSAEVSKEQLRLAGEGYKLGFFLRIDGAAVMAVLGSKAEGHFVSRNCTVTVPGLPLTDAKHVVEQNFVVTRLHQFKQGLSQIVLYATNLTGFRKNVTISIQHSSEAALTSVSLFETE
jgi:hypothetical protein